MMNLNRTIEYYDKMIDAQKGFIPCDGCTFDECKDLKIQLRDWLKELRELRQIYDCDTDRMIESKMPIAQILRGLRFTEEMFLFNPDTGEKKTKEQLNDMDLITYNAVVGAIEALKAFNENGQY